MVTKFHPANCTKQGREVTFVVKTVLLIVSGRVFMKFAILRVSYTLTKEKCDATAHDE